MLIEIGKITKTQGLKGEFRVKVYSDDNSILLDLGYIIINNKRYDIEKIQDRSGFAVVKLYDFNHINEVEKLVGATVFVNKEDIELDEDEFLVDDLIGFTVKTSAEEVLGKLIDISSFGAGDLYTVKKLNLKEIVFPNVRDVIISIDEETKTIIVDKTILEEIATDN